MPRGVKHDLPVIRKLLVCDCRPTIGCILNCFLQVINSKVQMRHLLLSPRLWRPHRRLILRVPLKHNTGVRSLAGSRGADTCPIFIIKRYFPLEQLRIELCSFIRVDAIHRKCVHFNFQLIFHYTKPPDIFMSAVYLLRGIYFCKLNQ